MIEIIKLIISVEFIEKWQILIGSALGPFSAIMLSVLGLFIKGKLQKIKDRKEAIRRAEIAFAQTLNHIFISVMQLKDFVERAKIIIDEVKKVTDPKIFTLQETNFPPIINIYFDEELSKMKFKSYYLHNKILITEDIVRWSNSTTLQFRSDFERLLKRNEMMAEKTNPQAQREAYIQNLEGFIEMVVDFLNSLEKENTKSIVQAKVYNLKLMKKYSRTILKYEGASLKYFKNKKKLEKYNGSLEAVDRINDLLEKDTNKLMSEVKERARQHEK